MNPSHRRSWTLLTVLALALMGLFSSAVLVASPAGQAPSFPCEAAKSIEESQNDSDGDGLTDDQEKSGALANSGLATPARGADSG